MPAHVQMVCNDGCGGSCNACCLAWCSVCGGALTVGNAGWSLRCDADDVDHFPRTDPAVIVRVRDDELQRRRDPELHARRRRAQALPEVLGRGRRLPHAQPKALPRAARRDAGDQVRQLLEHRRRLRQRPQLLSPAVRCFYEREPVDLKAAAAMRKFGYALKGKKSGTCASVFVLLS